MRKFSWLFSLLIGSWMMAAMPLVTMAQTSMNVDMARAAMQRKDWQAANYEWRHILKQEPDNLEAIIGLADSLFNTEFYQEAIELLEEIPAARRPLLAEYGLARTYAAMKNYTKSKDIYLQLLRKKPYQIAGVKELQSLLMNLTPAERKQVRSVLDTIAKAARAKGETAMSEGRYQEAAGYYEIAATQLHTVGLVNDYALILLLSGQYQKAHDQFAMLRQKGKLRFSEANSNAAIASLSIGNFAEAKVEIQQAINAASSNRMKAKLYNNMGYILEMSRKRQEAKFAYQHALELDPELTTAQMNLAFVQQANREYEEAIANYQQILKRDPFNVSIWNRLGFVYELQMKPKQALATYKQAIDIDSRNQESYYNLATLYKKMGKLKETNETLRQLAELSYQEMESPRLAASKPAQSKNPLKFVVLFPADPTVTSGLQ